jgi:hypothetical protein
MVKVNLKFAFVMFISIAASSFEAIANSSHPVRENLYSKTSLKKYSAYQNCIFWQAQQFKINELVLMSVLLAEGGNAKSKNKNGNGTYDYGIMQINDVRSDELIKLGYDLEAVRKDGCKNIEAATHILALEIERAGDLWLGIGRYHYMETGQNPKYHYIYRERVNRKLQNLLGIAKKSFNSMHLSGGQ